MKVITGEKYRISLYSENLFRLEYNEKGNFVDDKTQVVMDRDFTNDEINLEIKEDDNQLNIYTDYFNIFYNKNAQFAKDSLFIDFKFSFMPYGNRWYFGDPIDTLKGTVRTLDEVDGEVALGEGVVSYSGFSILDDSRSLIIDDDDIYERDDCFDIYIFAFGHEYLKAIQAYYHLTGSTPILPRYALGNWWSRYWAYSSEDYIELSETFKEKELPFSVMVMDMDWHLTDIPERFGSSWTGYTWNKELIPDPESLITQLKDSGYAITLNLHPADGIRAFESSYKQIATRLGLDIDNEEPALMKIEDKEFRDAYFEEVLYPLELQGVDFWWIDWQQGSQSSIRGLDPLWAFNHYHFKWIEKNYNAPLILSRYSGPGSHRYPVGFSGDTIVSWESLRFQPYMTSTASNIGYSWWSHDIGGHMKGTSDDELYIRWLQFGVFSPINRLHSSSSIFAKKEPWKYNQYYNQIATKYLQLRHRLIPYLYTYNVKTAEEGIPLILPTYYMEPSKKESYEYDNQYYFGSELLVLPITTPVDTEIKRSKETVYLPEGNWFNIYNNFRYKGGEVIDVNRDLSEMGIFAKEGAIIPLDKSIHTKATNLPEEIEWKVYLGKTNSFTLVEDIEGRRVKTKLTIDVEENKLWLEIEGDLSTLPSNRKHFITLCGTEDFTIPDYETTYDQHKKELTFVMDNQSNNVVDLSNLRIVDQQDIMPEVFTVLDKSNIDNVLKDELFNKFRNTSNIEFWKLVPVISEIENDVLKSSLLELIYVSMS